MIAVQKAAKVVPLVPKRVRVPPPTLRLVVLAVVAKKLVVVAEVPVALTKVKFWRVEDALAKRVLVVVRPAIVAELTVSSPLALMERALAVDVAKVEGDEVAIYSIPPAFLKDQWLSAAIPSERVS